MLDCLPRCRASDANGFCCSAGTASGGDEIRAAHPDLTGVYLARIVTTEQLSVHIRACDVMLQQYPDGVSTRRTSAMAALSTSARW